MTDLNRDLARRLMAEAGFDALALFQPEAFRHAIGASGGVATMWRREGVAIALVPAAPGQRLAAVVSDHAAPGVRRMAPAVDVREHRVWIDSIDLTDLLDEGPTASRVSAAYARQGVGGTARNRLTPASPSSFWAMFCTSAGWIGPESASIWSSCRRPVSNGCYQPVFDGTRWLRLLWKSESIVRTEEFADVGPDQASR